MFDHHGIRRSRSTKEMGMSLTQRYTNALLLIVQLQVGNNAAAVLLQKSNPDMAKTSCLQQQRQTHSHQTSELESDELPDTRPPVKVHQSSTGTAVLN